MAWPTSQDYNEAIQNPATSFSDPDLKKGVVALNSIGLPVPRSGNFADVYEFKTSDGKKWALKLFTRQVVGLQERYAKIDEHLSKAKFPFTVGFKYLAQGIRIRGQWYPVLKMEWVEGFTLNEFVRDNAGKPQYLHALMQMWGKLTALLRDADFAHADLQHGNVLLVPATTGGKLGLRLIDYDGMWVPALAETHSGEVGHPNFQHPLRLKDRLYNADVDRFPHLVIAAALRGTLIGGKPFWDKFDNGDNLLFKETDLRDPGASPVFKALWNLNDSVLCTIVGKMAIASKEPLRKTPWLDDLLLTDEGKRLSDVEEAKVMQLLGVGPHFTATATADAPAIQEEFNAFAFEDEEPTVKKDKSAGQKALAVKDDKKPRKGAAKEEKKSKLPLFIGGGVAAVLALVGIIIAASGGGGKKDTPSQQEQAKVEPKRETPKVVAPPEKTKDKEEPKVVGKKDEPKIVAPPKKDDPKEVVVVGQPALLKAPFTKEQAEKARAEWAKFLNIPERKELDLGKEVKLELVLIPPGEFMMGSKSGDLVPDDDEPMEKMGKQGYRKVVISKPFYMAATETTQEQYEATMGANPSGFVAGGANQKAIAKLPTNELPVECVSWNKAIEFCDKIKANLPTEAQWEYACRAGTTTNFSFGDESNGKETNCNGNSPHGTTTKGPNLGRTAKVKKYAPNNFGLFEMHGNVREWCRDFASDSLDDLHPIDPERSNKLTSPNRVTRGGSWYSNARAGLSAARFSRSPGTHLNNIGFRVMVPILDIPTAVAKLPDPDPKEIINKQPREGAPALLKSPFTKEQAEKARAEWAKFLNIPERKELDLGKGVKLELVLILPGEFMKGDQKKRPVNILKPFYIAATEMTQEQYTAVVGKNPSGFAPTGQNKDEVAGMDTTKFPVEKISWRMASEFCATTKCQLPTEAQWEYACRAGTTTDFHFGDTMTAADGNAGKTHNRTTAVKSYAPNAFGLYDMHGNVWEHSRRFDKDLDDTSESDPGAPPPPADSGRMIRRSGAWNSGFNVKSSIRSETNLNDALNYAGFRVVMPANGNPAAVAKLPDPDPKEIAKKDPPLTGSIGELKRLWQDKRSVTNAAGYPVDFTRDGSGILVRFSRTQSLQRIKVSDGVKDSELEYGMVEGCNVCSNNVAILHFPQDGKPLMVGYDYKTGAKLYELGIGTSLWHSWVTEDDNIFMLRTSERSITPFLVKDGTSAGKVETFDAPILTCSQSIDRKVSAVFTNNGFVHIKRPGRTDYEKIYLTDRALVEATVGCSAINERYAALVYKDSSIHVFDAVTGKELQTLVGHTQPAQALKFTTNPRFLISASDDESLRLWDVETGKLVQNINLNGRVKAFTTSPDGQYLCIPTNYPDSLQVFRFDPVKEPAKVAKKDPEPAPMPKSPDELSEVWKVSANSFLNSLSFSRDGSRLVVASQSPEVSILDARNGSVVDRQKVANVPVTALTFAANNRLLAVDNDKHLLGWDLINKAAIPEYRGACVSQQFPVARDKDFVFLPQAKAIDLYSLKDNKKPARSR